MESKYQDAKQLTNSIASLYLSLAQLHKEGKEETEEYKQLASLSPKAVEMEKNKYQNVKITKEELDENYHVLALTPKDNMYFNKITKETISAIRTLNIVDKERIYALDGIVLRNEGILKMQTYLDEAFFYEISMYLKTKAKESEKNILIDFKYALLASSPILEEKRMFFPKSNTSMTEEEMRAAQTYILPKINELTEYLGQIYDENIRPHTITYILYVKACIDLLPPLYKGIITEEIRNSIGLQRLLGFLNGKENTQICNMLTYLYEEDSIKEKQF